MEFWSYRTRMFRRRSWEQSGCMGTFLPDRTDLGRISRGRSDPGLVPGHAGFDEAEVGAGPVDGGLESLLQGNQRLETDFFLGLVRGAEAPAGAIPFAHGGHLQRN